MVTPRGQEWLRGLRSTDTDPNSLHVYFVSRRDTCLQPRVHICKPILRVMAPLPIITESPEAWNGGRDAALLIYLRRCSFQLPDEEEDHLMTLRGKLRPPFPSSLQFRSHTWQISFTFPHWWASSVASLVRHLGPNTSKRQLICKWGLTGGVSQDCVGLLWHRCLSRSHGECTCTTSVVFFSINKTLVATLKELSFCYKWWLVEIPLYYQNVHE